MLAPSCQKTGLHYHNHNDSSAQPFSSSTESDNDPCRRLGQPQRRLRSRGKRSAKPVSGVATVGQALSNSEPIRSEPPSLHRDIDPRWPSTTPASGWPGRVSIPGRPNGYVQRSRAGSGGPVDSRVRWRNERGKDGWGRNSKCPISNAL